MTFFKILAKKENLDKLANTTEKRVNLFSKMGMMSPQMFLFKQAMKILEPVLKPTAQITSYVSEGAFDGMMDFTDEFVELMQSEKGQKATNHFIEYISMVFNLIFELIEVCGEIAEIIDDSALDHDIEDPGFVQPLIPVEPPEEVIPLDPNNPGGFTL